MMDDATGFTLTDIERACGVTMDDVRALRARVDVRAPINGSPMLAVVEGSASPALAGAAARMALGAPVEYVRHAFVGHVYRLAGAL